MHTIPRINFRHLGNHLVTVTLNKAAYGYKYATTTIASMTLVEVLLGLNLLKQHVYGLLLSIANKATGVDDDGVAIVLITVEIDGVASLSEVPGYVLRINSVFATPKGDNIDFQW